MDANAFEPTDDDMGAEDDDVPVGRRVQAVIDGIAAFASNLPITVEARPYRNQYTGEVQGVVLTDLFADSPGNGVGSAVVRELLRLADVADLTVYTDADGPRSAEFYVKMGFERSTGRGHQFSHHPPLPDHLLDEDDAQAPGMGMR